MTKADIVKDAVRRFHHLGARTIARHILNTHGPVFNEDLELIRSKVRYYLGRKGEKNRHDALDKTLFRTEDVVMPETWRRIRTSYGLTPGLWLVLSDIHVPFHEPTPIESAIKCGQAENVNGILLNGDLQDCASLSYWHNSKRDFNREIELVIDFLDLLNNEFPKQKKVYKPGNHEYRLPRYFVSKAPELAESPLTAMETVIGFEDRDIEFLDYYQIVQAGKLPIIHGHEVRHLDRAVNPARGLFLRAKTFSACSHCHTTSQHTARNLIGDLISTWSFGCLCDLSPDYYPYANDWNWGFALINIEEDGNFEVVNRRILPNGKVV